MKPTIKLVQSVTPEWCLPDRYLLSWVVPLQRNRSRQSAGVQMHICMTGKPAATAWIQISKRKNLTWEECLDMEKRKMVPSFPIWQLCMPMHCTKPVTPKKDTKFFRLCLILQWILNAAKCTRESRNISIIREEAYTHIWPELQAGICWPW